jgi:hypothetical protein
MIEVYRINTIPGYKPWRSPGEYLLTKEHYAFVMEYMKDQDDYQFNRVPTPNAKYAEDGELINEDETFVEWLYEHNPYKDVQMPYTLMAETTYYVE